MRNHGQNTSPAAATASCISARSRGPNEEPQAISDNPKSTFVPRVRAVKPRGKRYDIRDDVIPGLFLRVFPTGARSFAHDR